MLDVVAALAQAGPAEGFGDDDGGRVWNPRRNRTEHMTDPLALGAMMYRKAISRRAADGGSDLVVWKSSGRKISRTPRTQPAALVRSLSPTAEFTCWPIRSPTRRR